MQGFLVSGWLSVDLDTLFLYSFVWGCKSLVLAICYMLKGAFMMKKRPAGFTITELLVVVVVIGILSAVVLPKFTKMLESYKTAEAEHMLEAVRNEQEARCELGDGYTSDTSKLGTWATDTSRYFNYSLQACGMSATRLGGDGYTLQIPLYEDGRICCEGCDTLNKDYLSCDELRSSLPTSCPCAAEVSAPPLPPGGGCEETPKPDTSCGCNNTGHYSATWNSDSCSWNIGTACLGEDTSGCGSGCVKPTKPAEPSCGCNDTGHREYTWNASACKWQLGTACVGEDASKCNFCEPGKPGWDNWVDKAQACEQPQDPDVAPGTWNTTTCTCDKLYCAPGKPGWDDWVDKAQECEQPQDPDVKPGTWNTTTCTCDKLYCAPGKPGWDKWSDKAQICERGDQHPNWVAGTWNTTTCKCDCPDGTTPNENGACIRSQSCEDTYGADFIEELKHNCDTGIGNGVDMHWYEGGYIFRGTWDAQRCECVCDRGYFFHPIWKVCVDPRVGAPEERPGCGDQTAEESGAHNCDYWDDMGWDNYDDMVDTWEKEYDYDASGGDLWEDYPTDD